MPTLFSFSWLTISIIVRYTAALHRCYPIYHERTAFSMLMQKLSRERQEVTSLRIQVCMSIWIYICISIWIYNMYKYLNICVYIYTYKYNFIHIYLYIYYTHVQVWIHVQITTGDAPYDKLIRSYETAVHYSKQVHIYE
jgi:hypothetical protein